MSDLIFYLLIIVLLYYFFVYLPQTKKLTEQSLDSFNKLPEKPKPSAHSTSTQTDTEPSLDRRTDEQG